MGALFSLFGHRDSVPDRGDRGMTTVELMVAMTIGGILVTLVFQFFISQTSSFAESRQTAELQQELRWAVRFVGDHLKLAGNGVPYNAGYDILVNTDGGSEPDSLLVMGSFRSISPTTTKRMRRRRDPVEVTDASEIEVGDLCSISDGTFNEIFMITKINGNKLEHKRMRPWNRNRNLDHAYPEDSVIHIASVYTFFVGPDDDGVSTLFVESQADYPQPLLGNIEDFQVRFKMKDEEYIDDISGDRALDVRMIEIILQARTQSPVPNYVDPVFGDEYKRIEVQSVVIPKNVALM
jgi:prepilin-type N-terminal cleavage/methylation domain-containing protein